MKEKISQCSKEIKKRGLDAVIISDPVNITYLTGFRQAEGYLLITTNEEVVYFTNFLYENEAKKISLWKVVVSSNNRNIFSLVKTNIKLLKLKKVGFESKQLPFLEYKKIKDNLSREGMDFIETIDLIEELRMIKNCREISLIKKSIEISMEAFGFIKEIHDETMTEKDLSIEIEKFLKLKGDNEIAFSSIVASGENSAYPHYQPGQVKLNRKLFLIDLGSKYCGYCADLTRVFFWDKMPHLFRKIYDIVKGAADHSIKKIKDGVPVKEVDKAARDFISREGYGKYFGHGLGHGVGMAVHEQPFIGPKNKDFLREGMVLTIEPAVYIPGKFGVRIEDMVLVKKEGVEVLNGNAYR